MEIFRCSWENKNNFELVSGSGEDSGGLWVGRVLLLFTVDVSGSSESQINAFLQYRGLTSDIYGWKEA